jgi:hypothetical protein
MKDLRKAAEMVLEVYDNDYGDIAKKIALSELRQALEKSPCCNHDCNEGRDCPERK